MALVLLIGGACAGPERPADYTERIPGAMKGSTVTFDMVGIPGDGPIQPFWIGRCEVTWDEYGGFDTPEMIEPDEEASYPYWKGQEKIPFRALFRDGDNQEDYHRWLTEAVDAVSMPSRYYCEKAAKDGGWGFGRRPAIKMNRRAAGEYCKWLTKMTGRAYRLPTEREWEHACRAGAAAPQALSEVAWFKDNSGGMTHPVGRKKPNAWGVHDMQGNVMEYVAETLDPPTDEVWFVDTILPQRRRRGILKGGCWSDPPEALRPELRRLEMFAWSDDSNKNPQSPVWNYGAPFVGFRVARSAQ
jgi:formylglycine-generating enzyme required for sulfatase activity